MTARKWIEFAVLLAVAALLAFLLQAFVVKPFRIPSPSMVPTLIEGQRVLVNRIGMHFSDPKVGNIVVFHPPEGAESNICGGNPAPDAPCDHETPNRSKEYFIKRIVAGPGDRIKIVGGHVVLNGKQQKESFINPCTTTSPAKCDFPTEITIPKDHYFMMGDNRGDSGDSRFWGPVPKKWIIGKAFFTYWPIKRIGGI